MAIVFASTSGAVVQVQLSTSIQAYPFAEISIFPSRSRCRPEHIDGPRTGTTPYRSRFDRNAIRINFRFDPASTLVESQDGRGSKRSLKREFFLFRIGMVRQSHDAVLLDPPRPPMAWKTWQDGRRVSCDSIRRPRYLAVLRSCQPISSPIQSTRL